MQMFENCQCIPTLDRGQPAVSCKVVASEVANNQEKVFFWSQGKKVVYEEGSDHMSDAAGLC